MVKAQLNESMAVEEEKGMEARRGGGGVMV